MRKKIETKQKILPEAHVVSLKIKSLINSMKIENWKLKIVMLLCLFFVPIFSYGATLQKAPNNLGLVGYWTFDEGSGGVATDFSGNGNSGSMSGFSNPPTATSGWTSAGKHGGALRFDGSDDFVNIKSDYVTTAQDWTMSFWIKAGNFSNYQSALVNGDTAGAGKSGFQGGVTNTSKGYITAMVGVDSEEEVNTLTTLSPQIWYNIVGVKNGTSLIIYLNGVQDNSITLSTATMDYTGTTVGTQLGKGTEGSDILTGSLDDVRIYGRVLTATEVYNLYKSGVMKANVSPTTKLTNGLVGYWTMDGKDINWTANQVTDRSVNGNTGTLTNMSTTTSPVEGKIGQALDFDSINDSISLGVTNLPANNSNQTLSAWAKYSSPPSDVENIVELDQGFGGGSVQLGFRSSDVKVWKSGGTALVSAGTLPSAGNWHLYTYTFDGTNHRIYIDGLLISTDTVAPNTDTTGRATIGGIAGTELFKGSIDDVRVYNRTLSASEVSQLYHMGATTHVNVSPTARITNGLVGYWTMDGKDINWAQNKVTDKSGNGYSGTFTNMSTTTSPTIGKIGQALYFDGSDDYIDIGDNLDQTGAYTISAWFKTVDNTAFQILVAKYDQSDFTKQSYYLTLLSGVLRGFLGVPAVGTKITNGLTTVSNNTWYHGAVVFSGVSTDPLKIYLNGVDDSGAPETNDTISGGTDTASSLFLGARQNAASPARLLNGSLDEVRIYNRALSASEIQQLYLMGSPR